MTVMRIVRSLPVFVAAALLLAVRPAAAQNAPAAPAGDTAKGASLLAEARTALGGADKLAAVTRLEMKGEFRRAQGNNTQEGDFDIQLQSPDKYKQTEESGVAGGPLTERVQGLNGAEIWDANDGGGFAGGGGGRFGGRGGFRGGRRGGDQPGADGQAAGAQAQGRGGFDPERLRDLQRRQRQSDLDRLLIVTVLSSQAPVAWIGTAKSPDGTTADVLEFRPQDGTPTRLFLDSMSHMPLMITWEGPARGGARGRFGRGGQGARGNRGGDDAGANGGNAAAAPAGPPQPTTLEMYLSDYKAENGIKLPHLIRRASNGQTQEEMTVKNYKLNPNFKSNTFEKSK
jgi:hypothetical protein